jgi:hypothetical protein
LIGWRGLAAAVYTQTTDVEIEVNGLLTYDRAVIKMPVERIAEVNRALYGMPPEVTVLVPASQDEAATWKYTMTEPGQDWTTAAFDDSSWQEGPAGFGTRRTPGAVVRTEWDGQEIWLRRKVNIPPDVTLARPHLIIHHDEDAEVSINGSVLAKLDGHTSDYALVPLDPQAAESLRAAVRDADGEIVLAVHCRQKEGGQYIDVGLVDVRERTSE